MTAEAGAVILSHDRVVLDRVATYILAFDTVTRKLCGLSKELGLHLKEVL